MEKRVRTDSKHIAEQATPESFRLTMQKAREKKWNQKERKARMWSLYLNRVQEGHPTALLIKQDIEADRICKEIGYNEK